MVEREVAMLGVNFRGYALDEWNINQEYEANTLVKDSEGNMFLSMRKVNKGENLGLSDAWIPVIDTTALSEKVAQLEADISELEDTVDQLEEEVEALTGKLTAVVSEENVPFEFVYDSTSGEYGYKDASGDFAPFTHAVTE